jgi:Fe-S cluster assembly iron-binding protein IscA
VKLFLPAESRLLLDGVTIDFTDTAAKTGLVFQDPKATSCGSHAH